MVAFNTVPSAIRTPFFTAEFDGSRAAQTPALAPYRALMIGQRITGLGTAVQDRQYRVRNADDVANYAGRGSQLHRMALAWFAENKATEVWIGVLNDDAAAVAATGTVTITGPATADGTLSLYIGGELVRVAVTNGMTATQIATAIVTAVGATSGSTRLPVKASNAAGVVTLTANCKGAQANEIDIRVNYQADSEALPGGVSVAIVGMASGATNPVLTNLIANLGDQWFHVVAHPYTDATSLTAIETEMASRAGPMRLIDGLAITAKNATYSTIATLGASRNSPYSTILRVNESPTNPAEYAASCAAVVALNSAIDPARPLQTLPLTWVKRPADVDLDQQVERNTLLYSGISTTRVGPGNVVVIDRLITTYQLNASGTADTAFLSVETIFTLLYLRFSFRAQISSRYPRHKLANDDVIVAPGQPIITPKIGKGEALAWFRNMQKLGLVENFDQFKADLVVERNASDPNRLDWLLPPDLMNQLVVGAAIFKFIV